MICLGCRSDHPGEGRFYVMCRGGEVVSIGCPRCGLDPKAKRAIPSRSILESHRQFTIGEALSRLCRNTGA